MHSVPVLCFFVPFKERELCDPEEVELALGDNVELLCNLKTECAEERENNVVLVCCDEDYIALFCARCFEDSVKLAVLEELAERAVRSIVVPADISKTLCTDALCVFDELVYFFSCKSCCCVLCCYKDGRRISLMRNA